AADSTAKRTAKSDDRVAHDVQAMATRIDQLIEAGWAAKAVRPAAPADDAEFLRRAYLDLAGRIPRVAEVHEFLDDKLPNKRQRLIERLLKSPHYINHFTNVWRAQMLPQANNQQFQFLAVGFETWLRQRLRENVPYDELVREILTAPVAANRQPRPGYNPSDVTPIAFYQANEMKAENLAASTSRLFLGVKLECAQCHNHPFARWSRQQFWEYAAFFAGVRPIAPDNPFRAAREKADEREIKIAGTDKTVKARFLDESEPKWDDEISTRTTLAKWLTTAQNPFFARAAANRMWAHFFGIGLVEPADDLADDNPPSHPELLDELARQFAAHDFDFKFLIRAITASKAYQLSSAITEPSQLEPRAFARMPVKGLTAEQLFDSLALATGYREQASPNQRFGFNANDPRTVFQARFASQDKRTETQTSILQALALMNGKFIADATSLDRSETLLAVVEAPFLNTAERIDALYLATITRKPRPDEATRLVKYVESGGPKKNPKAALADVFWAVLNSSEFILNH
ncbi:MAG TPA: DUF1549 and DUF1553 domain-containing protein, partial [Gemmataceae bacterium]|nr:DUF1549 and DUF1553 domain-containing protein [Gemmataceae bacterium]